MKPLLVYPFGGLGNQIRMIASSVFWARQLEVPLVVLYHPCESQVVQALRTLEHWELCFDLVSLPFTLMEFKAGRRVVDVRYSLKGDLEGLALPDLMIRAVDKEWVLMSDSAFGMWNQKRLTVIENPLQSLVPSFRTVTYVNQFLRSAVARFGSDVFKGVHLRYAQTPAFAYSPLELFVEHLRGEAGPFILVSDMIKARENFLKKFARQDVVYPQWDTLRQTDAEDVWRSWVDMILLSRCSPIYGCYFSSFDEVASYLGNTKVVKLHRGLRRS